MRIAILQGLVFMLCGVFFLTRPNHSAVGTAAGVLAIVVGVLRIVRARAAVPPPA
jgi:uncharacterized membrane protein HdeD (DUF308 family)